ncbi:MAG: TolC family protein [Pedobacter sp.]|nr:TolC family protein [Pedobacter sp.]
MFISPVNGIRLFISVIVSVLEITYPIKLRAQDTLKNSYPLSLNEAISMAKRKNKWVLIAETQAKSAQADLKDAYNAALPVATASSSYQRFSDLTLYTQGLSHSITRPRAATPNAANLGLDASFNLYSGGKQKAYQAELESRKNMADVNTNEQSGNYAMQTASQYLNLVQLAELKKFILDQLKRAEIRLKMINSLYKNQKVTRSDVLRADVMLSNVQLSLQQVDNDIQISNRRLTVLLNLPETIVVMPTDSAGMTKPVPAGLAMLTGQAQTSSFSILKARQNINTQEARLKGMKSANMPTLSFYTAYGLNYPNNLFYPPVDQAYSIGFVGLKAQYNISSLYHNKHKVEAGKLRIAEAQLQNEAIADNVDQEVKSLLIKYGEALNRITVKEKNIEQSRVNYRIVSTKYFNQLALLTDLLDADNLLTASRFDLITAQTDALTIYYRLLYATGKL